MHTVELYHPSAGGSQEVVRQISERMVKLGHDVTVATSYLPERKKKILNGVKIKQFKIAGNQVIGIKGEVDKYKKFLTGGDFDVMMNYAAQQWGTDLAFDVLDEIKAKKILVPCGYSALDNPAFAGYFKKMPAILKKYDASIYLSDSYQDINLARKHKVKNLRVIPNGADENEFKKIEKNNNFKTKYNIKHFFILSIGNHTGSKGHAEMLKVFRYFPYPSTFVIVGKESENGCIEQCQLSATKISRQQKKYHKKVLLLDLSRPETTKALTSADLFFFLSNVEASPLVLFEATAAEVPFLSSAAGNSAEIASWTGGGLVAASYPRDDRPGNVMVSEKDALRKLIKLRLNPILRRKLAKNGRRSWEKKYTWQQIAKDYLKLYEEVTQ